MARLQSLAGILLVVAGMALAAAGVFAVGEAQSWDVADAFAADSVRSIRRAGMMLGLVGVASFLVSLPAVVARLYGTPGFWWAVIGWVGVAGGAALFLMVLGLTAIALPALGELARDGLSPQQVVDGFVRQPAIMVAFLGGNVMFLSWVPFGIGLGRSGIFPLWLSWLLRAAAVAAWLGFLHVPGFQEYAGPLLPLAILLLGVYMLRRSRSAGVT